jgi:hypothetical protein
MDQLRFLPGTGLILEGVLRPGDNEQPVMEEPGFEAIPLPAG